MAQRCAQHPVELRRLVVNEEGLCQEERRLKRVRLVQRPNYQPPQLGVFLPCPGTQS